MKSKAGIGVILMAFIILIGSSGFIIAIANATTPVIFEKKGLSTTAGEYFPERIVVKFKLGVSDTRINELNLRYGCSKLYKSPFANLYVLKIPEEETVAGMLKKYREEPIVEYAQANYISYAFFEPNDPYYSYQWHFPIINMEQAWDIQPGGDPSVVVAVLDTGVAYENYQERRWWSIKTYKQAPDLAGTSFVAGWDFINNDAHPNDDNAHGTHVTGTIAQTTNNGYGVAGIAFKTSIMPVKVLDSRGSGTDVTLADGIRWAADNGADVISMSLGFASSVKPEDIPLVTEAVQYAYEKGVILVASSGNDGGGVVSLPAAYPEVIAVGAVHSGGARADYSQYGTALDLVAPGGDDVDRNGDGYMDGVLQETFNPNTRNPTDFGFWFFAGTSMATPHVSGLVALLLAQGRTGDEIRNILYETAVDKGTPGWDQEYGWGLIDAYAALTATVQPDTEPPIISNVKAIDVTSTSATITWTTDEASNSAVRYGTTTALGSVASDSALVTSHSITLTNLEKNTLYYYEVESTDASENTAIAGKYTFTTQLNQPPVADAGPDQSALIDKTIEFDASGSYDPDGTIVSYDWDFGDGTLHGASEITTHAYEAAGTYTVTLKVTDNDGAMGTDTMVVTVTEAPTTYPPASVSITTGTISSGGVGSLSSDDSSYLAVKSARSGWFSQVIDWYSNVTIETPSTVTSLAITYDGKYSASRTQTLYIYNFASNTWEKIDSRSVGTSDTKITWSTSNPSNYISSTGEIRLRVYASSYSSFTCYADFVSFTIKYSS